jgi:hypothetical protein
LALDLLANNAGNGTKVEMNNTLQKKQPMNTTIYSVMKVDQILQRKDHPRNKPLTFGDFVAGVYHTWGKRRANGIIQLALEAHVIKFLGDERFVIS